FAQGSMLPKVEAAMAFAKNGGASIIASLQKASLAICGKSGTIITL
ncbi:MAG: carbamate kinase, partial [Oscillospiraceae bacterium]